MLAKQLFAFALPLLLSALPSFAQDDDIKQVIAKETSSYFNKDAEALRSCWVQDSSISVTYVSIFEYYRATGWDSINARNTRYFLRSPKPDSVDITRDSFSIRKEGNLAIVNFKQTLKLHDNQPPFDQSTTSEQRILVRSGDTWKIAAVSSVETTLYQAATEELTLNNVGYSFLAANKLDEAIKIFELNTKFFPDSYNVWDSLGEAYAKAGKKKLALQNYEKSVKINPKSESGKKAIGDLKK